MHYKPSATSWIEISKSALEHNIQFIKGILPADCIFSSVIKGNAYGHDIDIYGPMAYDCGIRHFSVYSAQEAARILKVVSNDCTILCLGNLDKEEINWANAHGVEYYVNNFPTLENAIASAQQNGNIAKVHIEVETGMNRTGFPIKDLKKVFSIVAAASAYVQIIGICTHLAGAESITNYKRITEQIKRFKNLQLKITQSEMPRPIYHLACSAVAIRYPKQAYDLARIGIIQYGFFPNNETYMHYLLKNPLKENPLRRVISWKSKVVDLKMVKAGEFVGYGTTYYTNVPTKIAIIPVGYAYGYARSLSNHGRILINGVIVDVIGTINMNMLTVDVSILPDVQLGDEAVMIGKQGDQELSVSSFSEFSNQLNYELLARLPMEIERKVVE